jgi:hypothetical protein
MRAMLIVHKSPSSHTTRLVTPSFTGLYLNVWSYLITHLGAPTDKSELYTVHCTLNYYSVTCQIFHSTRKYCILLCPPWQRNARLLRYRSSKYLGICRITTLKQPVRSVLFYRRKYIPWILRHLHWVSSVRAQRARRPSNTDQVPHLSHHNKIPLTRTITI